MGAIRIFFASDFHGSEICFRKFLNAAKAYKADILIAGGDVTGKIMVPIVAQGNGNFRTQHLGSEVLINTQAELEAQVKTMRNAGLYPICVTQDELAGMGEVEVDQRFQREMRQVLESWVQLAEERLKPHGVRCLMMPGNDDYALVDDVLNASKFVVNVDGRVVDLQEVEVVGLGKSNITPWHCPRDITEAELAAHIDRLAGQVRDFRRCIFDIHVPPRDSQLDTAPALDSTFKPKTSSGQIVLDAVGSTAVRAAIEHYQPLLGLHGHIHESRGAATIGKTVCLNPGSEYQIGLLNGALVALNDRGKMDWWLTSG